MNAPLGRTVGNALETREAIQTLRGDGPDDIRELTLVLATEMLLLAGGRSSARSARKELELALASGRALDRFRRMVAAHGGDARVADDVTRLPRARVQVPVLAPRSGFVTAIDPLELGLCAVALGAGRTRADQAVDPAAGIVLEISVGDAVSRGQPLAVLHADRASRAREVADRVSAAFAIRRKALAPEPLVIGRIRAT
jgi:pyrimidine-nucleoside phosphorylase